MRKVDYLRRWAQTASHADVFVYYRTNMTLARDPAVFEYARKLHDAGLAFLFQRRIPGTEHFEYCARRTRPKDHAILDVVSASIPAPSTQQEV